MPKAPKSKTSRSTTRVASRSKRSAVWTPSDIHRAGTTRAKIPRNGTELPVQATDDTRSQADRPRLEVVVRNGGGQIMEDLHNKHASPTHTETPAEMPVEEGPDFFDNQRESAFLASDDGDRINTTEPTGEPLSDSASLSSDLSVTVVEPMRLETDAAISDDDRATHLAEPPVPLPETSSAPVTPKRGRPRRSMQVTTTDVVVTGEAPSEPVVQQDAGSADQVKPSQAPMFPAPDPATPSPAPARGRQRRAREQASTLEMTPDVAPKPARKGRPAWQTIEREQAILSPSAGPSYSPDPALPVGGVHQADDAHIDPDTPEPTSEISAEAPVGDGQTVTAAQRCIAVPTPDTVDPSTVSSDPAISKAFPDANLPDAAPPDTGIGYDAVQGQDQRSHDHPSHGRPDLAPIVAELQELQRKRIFCIKSLTRQSNATLALLRTLLGWRFGANEAENAKINKRARELVKNIEARERLNSSMNALSELSGDAPIKTRRALQKEANAAAAVVDKLRPLEGAELEVSLHYRQVVIASAHANAPWDTLREEYESRMRELARSLPIFPWVDGVRGFAEIGIAKIIGEAGDLGKYNNPAKLWKRLGLAVINGRRQGDPGPGASAEDWIEHGYSPKRRSEVWNITDSLIRAQWRGAKEDAETGEITEGHPLGYYGKVYAARKAYETQKNEAGDYANIAAAIVARSRDKGKAAPENLEGRLTKKHIDSRARRYVAKRLVKHAWQRWRNPQVPETDAHVENNTGS